MEGRPLEQDSGEAAISLTLPWPSRDLSPNARIHWSRRAKAVKQARWQAWAIAKEAIGANKPDWSGAHVTLTFHPPDKRRRDADGMLSMMKASIDGISDAIGINDHKFTYTFSVSDSVKGGSVNVRIEEINGRTKPRKPGGRQALVHLPDHR